MITVPIKNGVAISPETDFEGQYLKWLFTANQERKVTFNHDMGNLRVVVQEQADRIEEE